MATKAKKAAPRKTKAAPSKSGAATATAAKSKDAGKKTFGKAAPKTVKPASLDFAAVVVAAPLLDGAAFVFLVAAFFALVAMALFLLAGCRAS